VAADGFEVLYIVIDLDHIKLIGGDSGLGDFWNRWRDCVIRVKHLPGRLVYQNFFADEMRKAPLMQLYVRDYDEMTFLDSNKTWE
jgi:hypothetical protein